MQLGTAKTAHIDHNGLNNRKSNLRICTNSQNLWNQRVRSKGGSKYKGVVWHRRDKKRIAQINPNKRHTHLGYFENEIEAAIAYDRKAVESGTGFLPPPRPCRDFPCLSDNPDHNIA